MSKIILLNGPIGAGKTKAVEYLQKFYPLVDRRCKDKLFDLTMQLFCVAPETFWKIYNNRTLKELPNDNFMLEYDVWVELMQYLKKGYMHSSYGPKPISIRDAMIYVSEFVCKPSFGKDYFGKARALAITPDEIAIDDSCGFEEELLPIVELLGQDNILLIRIYGRGTFDGDSRKYITSGISNVADVYNVSSEEEYLNNIKIVVEDWLNGQKG